MICLKNVSKEFNKTKVLSDINLNIDEGQLIRIVGNNGCGKTTLLKILAGILKADDGDITYSEDCNIGAVIENPSFEYSANRRPLVTVEKSTKYAEQVHFIKILNTLRSPL